MKRGDYINASDYPTYFFVCDNCDEVINEDDCDFICPDCKGNDFSYSSRDDEMQNEIEQEADSKMRTNKEER
jgi:Zn finger protein HypA/HybF involved in hydrogenase expression